MTLLVANKYLHLLAGFWLVFTIQSCHKVTRKHNELVGQYEWVYTKISAQNYLTFDEADHRFGIEITESDRLVFFRDTEIQQVHKLYLNNSIKEKKDTLFYKAYKLEHWIKFSGDTLLVNNYPFWNSDNYFLKK